jgi:thiol-disulfide isomerase/thioredoxin
MSTAPAESPRKNFLTGLVGAVLALAVLWGLLTSHRQQENDPEIGTPLPPIIAVGWLNGPAPKPGEFDGKVLVIDAWASWCGPCRAQAPEMVRLYEKYHEQGAEFIGLTNETEESLPRMEQFIKRAGITWKNGYGAAETLDALKADYIPKVWVVDRQRRIVWSHASPITLEEGLRKALSSK